MFPREGISSRPTAQLLPPRPLPWNLTLERFLPHRRSLGTRNNTFTHDVSFLTSASALILEVRGRAGDLLFFVTGKEVQRLCEIACDCVMMQRLLVRLDSQLEQKRGIRSRE